MKKKHKSRYRILWYILPIMAFIVLSIIIVPPMIQLNFLKSKIENVILSKTGIPVTINGNVHASMLGKARIVAHNLTIPNGTIADCEFTIPFFDLFNLKNASISDTISVSGAILHIDQLTPFDIKEDIIIKNSTLQFLNKEYRIINAKLSEQGINANVRTDQHKYEIKAKSNQFTVKNYNNNLNMSGKLLSDGTATAHISIVAQDINKWFEFDTPRITGQFPITADLKWNGSYGVDFYNISANGVTGKISLQEDGYKIIDLKSQNADYDMSFLVTNLELLKNAAFNLNFSGKLQFMDKTFKRLEIKTIGSDKDVKIDTIIADSLKVQGGYIDKDGAHNVNVSLPENGISTTCLFNGTHQKWSCERFSYGNTITGELEVDQKEFIADIKSSEKIKNVKSIVNSTKFLGNRGIVKFDFPDMSGILNISGNAYDVTYEHIDNKTLKNVEIDLPFLPEFMLNENGNFIWNNNLMLFIPDSRNWQLSLDKDLFILHGDNFKAWFKDMDLRSLRDLQYTISGNYKNGNISNLILEIADHKFVGTASKKSITLKTDLLNTDYFIEPGFKEKFEEMSFFTQAPIMLPFDIDTNIALSADALLYNNQRYNNFVYSLHKNIQTFSITDSDRGNLLATIKKNNIKYDINIQLNKFVFDEKLLSDNMPLNVDNTTITAEIKLKTSGKIAHDIINNLNGTFDASFEGGRVYGFGFNDFYAFAPNIQTLNAEQELEKALNGGISELKKMRIVGTYDKGNIKTVAPLTLEMRHVDANGSFEIIDKRMSAKLKLLLRGTSASPEPIELTIYPNGKREFSLSEIRMNFDPEYMRAFVQTHNKF